jgi:Zn-dependent M28 family amino/carboxypeptidase
MLALLSGEAFMKFAALAASLLLSVSAAQAAAPATVSPAEKKAAAAITPELLRSHIRFLASDLLEGRGPATRGDALAEAYIQSQMEALGLKPGAPDGSWLQKFDIVGITSHVPETIEFRHGADKLELHRLENFMGFSGVQTPEAKIDNAEVVFVGYGIVAPEYQWNDFKGMDLKGKVLLVMNNDPENDPKLFEGKTRLYYGRWDYKYEEAARQGAAGVIIIHTDHSAAYKWQVVQTSWSGEGFSLPWEGQPRLQVESWATEDASRNIAKLGGFDLDQLRAAAEKRDFKPVPLGVTLSLTLKNDIRKQQTANVIGVLPGSDPKLKSEALFFTAHHDHLGIREGARPGEDSIYNGALDNASGVASILSIAKATMALPKAPKRSIYFAAVAGEEQGLLGSGYLAAHPPIPAGRIAADLNIDGINIWGRTRDVSMIGLGKSSLDNWSKKIAAMQGRVVTGDQVPDKGAYYRSDQFSFAHYGVPGAYFDAGTDVIGKPKGWGAAQHQRFDDEDYHQPSDELRDSWDFSGAVEDVQLMFYLGLKVGNDAMMPSWKAGDEFEAIRKKMLAAAAAK